MRGPGQDLRVTFRNLGRNRSFTLAAILTLALGIGANSAMFTVIRAVLLKPLAYRDPGRLVEISGGATIARFDEIEAAQKSYTQLELSSVVPPRSLFPDPTDRRPARYRRSLRIFSRSWASRPCSAGDSFPAKTRRVGRESR
jgi:hypothetical protein